VISNRCRNRLPRIPGDKSPCNEERGVDVGQLCF
jgi:hypothetical protein